MKLGRHLPSVWNPTLDVERYLGPIVPARALGKRWESKSIKLLHDPAGNMDVGDCTCAGILKLDVAWSHNAGSMIEPDMKASALGLYSRATGYDPSQTDAQGNNPTDQGGDLQGILSYVKQHGIYGDGSGKVAGWCAVDASKPLVVRKAIDTFGGLYTGCSLPGAWLHGATEGTVWDVAGEPDPDAGHCMAWFDYNDTGVIIQSWGYFILVTWAAIEKYWAKAAGGEIYAVFSPDWLDKATRVSPSGLNAAQLAADVKAGF